MKKRITKKANTGITLIALVITMVVLGILAGVAISLILGNNGLLKKSEQAKMQYNMSQYIEEINMEIIQEKIQRQTEEKDEAFIISLNNRLFKDPKSKKAWINNTKIYYNRAENELSGNTILEIKTIQGYDIFVYVNNDTEEARIYEGNIEYTEYAEYLDGDDNVPPTITIESMAKSTEFLFAISAQVTITDDYSGVDYSNCKYVFKETKDPLGTEPTLYNDGLIDNTGIIKKAKGEGEYYLHVLATDYKGNSTEKISENTVTIDEVVNFDYATNDQGNGIEQHVDVLPGQYKLECWGAQGGNSTSQRGGYGGYSTGTYEALEKSTLYINVGGTGENCRTTSGYGYGGYNGGGNSTADGAAANNYGIASGGGATHIATVSGELSQLGSYKDTAGINKSNEILIVAGGGGGGYYCLNVGGDGGGTSGSGTSAGSQTGGARFGAGSSSNERGVSWSGGGGGFYGGGLGRNSNSGGGSGYIGSPLLTNKHMAGFNVSTSNDTNTKTISLTNEETQVSSVAESDKAKMGNGYARITNLNQ